MIKRRKFSNYNEKVSNRVGLTDIVNQPGQEVGKAVGNSPHTGVMGVYKRIEVDGGGAKKLLPRQVTKRERVTFEEDKRNLRFNQDEQVKQLRNLLADSLVALKRLKKLRPVN